MPKNVIDNPARFEEGELATLVKGINATYRDSVGVNLQDDRNLPGRREVLEIVDIFEELLFPGFNNSPRHRDAFNSETANLLVKLRYQLFDQISRALRFGVGETECDEACVSGRALEATRQLMNALPALRETMKLDVQAAYNGDPAASSLDEIVLSYPGIKAITIQRFAHELYKSKIPLIPRLMTEYAHTQTGIDIHPGAKLGRGVFIDHGTGVVIGETAEIGDNVRIYQGVTLGALSFPKDACGILIKGRKRHPSVCENVTLYSGATVLGDIVIGAGSIIGGNVWVTESLPPGTKITARPPEQLVKLAQKDS